MFSVINKEVQRVTAWAGCLLIAGLVWSWFADVRMGTPVEWALAWLVGIVVRVSDKLAAWEAAQLPQQIVLSPSAVPLDVQVRECLARGDRIEALRRIRADTGMSLDAAKEYLTQFDVTS